MKPHPYFKSLLLLLLFLFTPSPTLSFSTSPLFQTKTSFSARYSSASSSNDLLQKLNETFRYSDRIKTRDTSSYRCGYVSIIGLPNMGKSTLMNALLDEELCAITPLPQTTRHSILGILSTNTTQLLFLDTPGIISDPAYKLQSIMMDSVQSSLRDADVIVFVTEFLRETNNNDENDDEDEPLVPLSEQVRTILSRKNVIVALNKIDLATSSSEMEVQRQIIQWRTMLPNAIAILPTCANDRHHPSVVALKRILLGQTKDVPEALRNMGRPYQGMFRTEDQTTLYEEEIANLIPCGPALYDDDDLTDRNERFLTSEMVRQALFSTLKKEVPYCCEVQVEQFKNHDTLLKIKAIIYVERESQKGIVIGKKGVQIKAVGINARKTLESFYRKQVHLELSVKVDANWRKREDRLKEFGYLS